MKMAWPILIIAFGAALDLAAKLWARASLEPYGAATEFLPFVALRLTFNHGVSFSLLSFEGEIARLTLLLATAALGCVDKKDSPARSVVIQGHLYVGDDLGTQPDV